MKNLMRKELVLAMHPASVLFLLLSAMLLIPNYPYYVICFYTCLGTFFICLTGRENRDIEFTALLPVRKTDLVRARVFTVMLMQLAQLVIAVPFAVFSSRVSAENLVGMDANTAFFGFALVLYGVFNLVFFRNYYRAPGKVGKAFGWGCGPYPLHGGIRGLRPHRPLCAGPPGHAGPGVPGRKAHLIGRWRRTVRAAVGAGIAARHAQLCRAGPVSQPRVLQCKTSKGRVVKPCLSLSKKLRFYAPRHWPCGASRGYFK